MKDLILQVLNNTSPAEMKHLKKGCIDTAEWLVSHTEKKLTQYQVESVALKVIEYVKNS